MKKYIEQLEKDFSPIQNGFKEEERRALQDYQNYKQEEVEQLAHLTYQSEVYQVRMYGVFLFGYLSQKEEILAFMREEVSKDDNWRVQEVLAKAFDEYCKKVGYEKALPIIDEWLTHPHPNTRRAVTEGYGSGRADRILKNTPMKLSEELPPSKKTKASMSENLSAMPFEILARSTQNSSKQN